MGRVRVAVGLVRQIVTRAESNFGQANRIQQLLGTSKPRTQRRAFQNGLTNFPSVCDLSEPRLLGRAREVERCCWPSRKDQEGLRPCDKASSDSQNSFLI